MVLVKNWSLFHFFFLMQLRPAKDFLLYSKTKKTLFEVIKTRGSKSRKIDIFPKGLTHCFGQKLAIFPPFFLKHYRPGKCFLLCSSTKKRLSRL